ncbi:MAG TPA: glutamine-hydrolyzing GMP synthase, partial [Flavobacteriales bacterium]|nr:glutamine-hydrolyzing GMP synthase [Flavobacteriales bacterium]
MQQQTVIVLDFGSQYTQLIARRIRQLGIYCEIHRHDVSFDVLQAKSAAALILSGGPASIYDADAPSGDERIFTLDIPILGICYGMQWMAKHLGAQVVASDAREYGRAWLERCSESSVAAKCIFEAKNSEGEREEFEVWMSHGDKLLELPAEFVPLAKTTNTPFAAIAHKSKAWVGLQFHPEVSHTPRGQEILHAFLFQLAGLRPDWNMHEFLEMEIARVQKVVAEDEQVICGLSGGVDSTVVAMLLDKAIGKRLHCIFVDNGLLRQDEVAEVKALFHGKLSTPLSVVDAGERFLNALEGVVDPEKKRKIIGHVFIDVFEEEAKKIEGAVYLAQGTLYPDVVESSASCGPAAVIKSHHNVGGLPEKMNLKLLEPLR